MRANQAYTGLICVFMFFHDNLNQDYMVKAIQTSRLAPVMLDGLLPVS